MVCFNDRLVLYHLFFAFFVFFVFFVFFAFFAFFFFLSLDHVPQSGLLLLITRVLPQLQGKGMCVICEHALCGYCEKAK